MSGDFDMKAWGEDMKKGMETIAGFGSEPKKKEVVEETTNKEEDEEDQNYDDEEEVVVKTKPLTECDGCGSRYFNWNKDIGLYECKYCGRQQGSEK